MYKGTMFIYKTKAKCAFVSTNSVTQGEHIALLWKQILSYVEINFAYTSFKWVNNAKYNAGVICVIVGLANKNSEMKVIYTDDKRIQTKVIPPSLSLTQRILVGKSNVCISGFPSIRLGNMPNDNTILRLDRAERDSVLSAYPNSIRLFKRFVGSVELINSIERKILFVDFGCR